MTVTSPDWSPWWDVTATVAAVLDQLRLTDTDVDAERIEALVPAAGAAINAFLDRPDTTPPAPAELLQDALERVTVDLYQRQRIGQGSPEDFSVVAITGRLTSADPLGNVRAQLQPYKRRWGVG